MLDDLVIMYDNNLQDKHESDAANSALRQREVESTALGKRLRDEALLTLRGKSKRKCNDPRTITLKPC